MSYPCTCTGSVNRCACQDDIDGDWLIIQRNEAYSERARIVSSLTLLFPSRMTQHEGWWIVYMDTPHGQVSWHISEDDLGYFGHVPRVDSWQWDNHTTNEKYLRLDMTFDDIRDALAKLKH